MSPCSISAPVNEGAEWNRSQSETSEDLPSAASLNRCLAVLCAPAQTSSPFFAFRDENLAIDLYRDGFCGKDSQAISDWVSDVLGFLQKQGYTVRRISFGFQQEPYASDIFLALSRLQAVDRHLSLAGILTQLRTLRHLLRGPLPPPSNFCRMESLMAQFAVIDLDLRFSGRFFVVHRFLFDDQPQDLVAELHWAASMATDRAAVDALQHEWVCIGFLFSRWHCRQEPFSDVKIWWWSSHIVDLDAIRYGTCMKLTLAADGTAEWALFSGQETPSTMAKHPSGLSSPRQCWMHAFAAPLMLPAWPASASDTLADEVSSLVLFD